MFILKSIVFFILSCFYINSAFSENVNLKENVNLNVKIYSTKYQKFISQKQLFQNVPSKGQLVLGENHYEEATQQAEGDIIKGVLLTKKIKNNFSTCWEFLNYPQQLVIDSVFLDFKKHLISVTELLSKLFANRNPEAHHSYRHLLNVTRLFNGEIIALNASRIWKQVITKQGLKGLTEAMVPVNMELGGAFYKERFVKAMNGHVSKEKLPYYFQAQSYTDSVMADSIQNASQQDLKFVVTGSFHSDFNDGLVAQLKKYHPNPTTTIKIIDVKNFSAKDRKNLLKPHSKYGAIADYIYMLNGI